MNKYADIYTEVFEILQHLDKTEYNKIPDDGWEVLDKYTSTYIYGKPTKK